MNAILVLTLLAAGQPRLHAGPVAAGEYGAADSAVTAPDSALAGTGAAHSAEAVPNPRPAGAPGGIVVSLSGGTWDAHERAGHLESPVTPVAFCGGLAWPRAHGLEFGIESTLLYASYTGSHVEGSGWTTVSDQRSFLSTSFAASVRSGLPRGAVRPYVRAGIGLAFSSMKANEYDYSHLESWFGVPSGSRTQSDQEVVPHVAAGLDFVLGPRTSIGLEVRQAWMRGRFGWMSGGSFDLAGPAGLLVLRSTRARLWGG